MPGAVMLDFASEIADLLSTQNNSKKYALSNIAFTTPFALENDYEDTVTWSCNVLPRTGVSVIGSMRSRLSRNVIVEHFHAVILQHMGEFL
jgi:hypothetical protein